MSGIVVGIDGSHNASHALEWAMTEAAIRNAPLTVITVNSVPASYWTGAPVTLPGDQDRVAEIRKTAEAAVEEIASKLGAGRPESVTVTALSGFPAQTLIDASKDSDLLVVGTAAAADSLRSGLAPSAIRSSITPAARSWSCRRASDALIELQAPPGLGRPGDRPASRAGWDHRGILWCGRKGGRDP